MFFGVVPVDGEPQPLSHVVHYLLLPQVPSQLFPQLDDGGQAHLASSLTEGPPIAIYLNKKYKILICNNLFEDVHFQTYQNYSLSY